MNRIDTPTLTRTLRGLHTDARGQIRPTRSNPADMPSTVTTMDAVMASRARPRSSQRAKLLTASDTSNVTMRAPDTTQVDTSVWAILMSAPRSAGAHVSWAGV